MSIYSNKIGILGGGQLGRMFIQAAVDFNVDSYVLDPDENAPCRNLCHEFKRGKLTDFDTVVNFGRGKDIITIEIEHVNVEALKKLSQEGIKVYPQPEVIEIIQDKRLQKQFYKKHHIPTSDFVLIENKQAINNHIDFLPAYQKLGTSGYDGRGVYKIASATDIDKALEGPGLLEKLVDFQKEISVIVARNEQGQIKTFPTVEMAFHPEKNLVEFLFAPADLTEEQHHEAKTIAETIISKLEMVGLLAVEMFVTKEGRILVNEVAPRPHNSGHQTIKANFTSQYEQHVRAIMGLPLGATTLKKPAAMVNLLGEADFDGPAKYHGVEEALAIEGVYIHLYGKKYTKPFRKMGHVTILDEDMKRLKDKAMQVKNILKVKA